jgi:hypothetical protein
MKNLVKTVFFVVMGCFAIALGVPSQHSEDRGGLKLSLAALRKSAF